MTSVASSSPASLSADSTSRHMSRYSTPVSELGSLTIGGHSSYGRDMVTTRAQAARRAASHRTASARTPATPPSSATRRHPRGASFSARQADMSDEDEDDSSEGEAAPTRPDATVLVQRAFILLSIYAPEGMLPTEIYKDPDEQTAESRLFQKTMSYVARRVGTPAELQGLQQLFVDDDDLWAKVMVGRFARFANLCHHSYLNDNSTYDAISALDDFKRVYDGCVFLITRERHILGDKCADLAAVMIRILVIIVQADNDLQSPYATGHNEHNLYRRFAMEDEHFNRFLGPLLALISQPGLDLGDVFESHEADFASAFQHVHARHANDEADSPGYRLQERLRQICVLLRARNA